MPELPEVETVKEALNQTVKGQTIKEIELRYEPMIKNMSADEFKEKLASGAIYAGSSIVRNVFKNFFKNKDDQENK